MHDAGAITTTVCACVCMNMKVVRCTAVLAMMPLASRVSLGWVHCAVPSALFGPHACSQVAADAVVALLLQGIDDERSRCGAAHPIMRKDWWRRGAQVMLFYKHWHV